MSKTASRGHTAPDQHDVDDDKQHEPESENESESEGENEDDYAPHRDPERLEPAYERFGTLDKTANYFGVSPPTIRKYLREYGLYTSEYKTDDGECSIRPCQLKDVGPEDVGLPPIGERR